MLIIRAAANRRLNRWQDATCIACGYALRGLAASRCPECGTVFDRSDPVTFNSGRHCGPVARWLLQPTRWLARFSGGIGICVVAAQSFFLLTMFETLAVLILVWIGMAGPYIFWSSIRKFVQVWYARSAKMLRKDRDAYRRISRNVLIATIVVSTRVPMLTPFWISQPALDHYANHLYRDVPMLLHPPIPNRWCGIYYVSDCQLSPTGVTIHANGRPLTYSITDPNLNRSESHRYQHLSGNWYVGDPFRSDFSIFPALH